MERVLILGGGFGGMYTAKHILKSRADVDVTMISERNYFLFVPLLHEVATGNIYDRNIVRPIRNTLDYENFTFICDRVERVDFQNRAVETKRDMHGYDYVVVALGSETNFFDTEGAAEHCYTLKDLHDASAIRNGLIDRFERASHAENPEEVLRTVVIGGGPTGVELACEFADWAERLSDVYPVDETAFSLHLVDLNERVLNGVDDALRDHAMHVLEDNNVQLHMGTAGETVTEDSVTLADGTELRSDMVIWAAGVRPVAIDVDGVDSDRGRIPVENDLRVEGYDDAFALGDVAAFSNPDGSTFPPTAQLAYQQAFAVGDNVIAALHGDDTDDFVYTPKGFLASLGEGEAVAKIHGVRLYGFVAWFLWRTVYLSKLVGWQNTLRVMIDWTFALLTSRDTSRMPT